MRFSKQILEGHIEMVILSILEDGTSYGYAIVKQINERSDGSLKLGEGTVYPLLHRLEEKEWIASTWKRAEEGRRRKYYRLSAKGKTVLVQKQHEWRSLVEVVTRVMEPKAEPSMFSGNEVSVVSLA